MVFPVRPSGCTGMVGVSDGPTDVVVMSDGGFRGICLGRSGKGDMPVFASGR